jgi:hypothetical protein
MRTTKMSDAVFVGAITRIRKPGSEGFVVYRNVLWYRGGLVFEAHRLDSGLIDSGRGSAKAEDASGTPTQSHISPSIL